MLSLSVNNSMTMKHNWHSLNLVALVSDIIYIYILLYIYIVITVRHCFESAIIIYGLCVSLCELY